MARTPDATLESVAVPCVPLQMGIEGAHADVVVLAGSFGPQPCWTAGVPRGLLPLPGTTIIEALLERLRCVCKGSCTVCVAGGHETLGRWPGRDAVPGVSTILQCDPVPRGTAGCIKACEPHLRTAVVLAANAALWLEDDPEWLLEQHRLHGNALTIFCARGTGHPRPGGNGQLQPAGLYCCDRSVLRFIPPTGYYDLKEQLVPALRRARLRVGVVVLRDHTNAVPTWAAYLHAIERAMAGGQLAGKGFREIAPDVWCGEGVSIAPEARIVSPTVLGHRCTVENGSVVIGPAVLGDGSRIGSGSWLLRVVAMPGTTFQDGIAVADRLVVPTGLAPEIEDQSDACHRPCVSPPSDGYRMHMSRPSQTPNAERTRRTQPGIGVSVLALAALFVWAFWHSFVDLWRVWQSNGDYSAGQLVPLASAYMIFVQRKKLAGIKIALGPAGIVLFAVGLCLNLTGAYYLYASLLNLGLVLCANGLVMSLLGWQGYKRIWYPLVFLLLMFPLPNRIQDAVMLPLQGLSARLSTGVLEIFGVPTVRYGNILDVGGQEVAVAEACSGLRMALAFLMVAGVVAYLAPRSRWQKITLVLSSVPIALICNVFRIVFTACLYNAGRAQLAQGTFHSLAGFLMMPLALCLIVLELWLLPRLVLTDQDIDTLGRHVTRSEGRTYWAPTA